MITLSDVEAARVRLGSNIRRAPMLRADNLSAPITDAAVHLKLECLQATGSFKARGATNRLLATPKDELARGIVTASGGNHGVAVARTGRLAGVAAHVFVPTNISPPKLEKLKRWGAEVELVGNVFDDAGRVVTIETITTIVPTMSCARTDEAVFELVRAVVDDIVLVEDAAMIEAAKWLWFEFGIAADLSGAAALAALKSGLVQVRPGESVCALVCGAGPEGIG
ncbi:MAG: pyridoxal-phosphate dependent enzyme [Rhizobiales bacterium]|nr:pyridoxal-phosphate dependent enzyme [Hyphomicrobiales bacterium]